MASLLRCQNHLDVGPAVQLPAGFSGVGGDGVLRPAPDRLEPGGLDVREVRQTYVFTASARFSDSVRFTETGPVESVFPSTRRYVFPNEVIVSPSASSTK